MLHSPFTKLTPTVHLETIFWYHLVKKWFSLYYSNSLCLHQPYINYSSWPDLQMPLDGLCPWPTFHASVTKIQNGNSRALWCFPSQCLVLLWLWIQYRQQLLLDLFQTSHIHVFKTVFFCPCCPKDLEHLLVTKPDQNCKTNDRMIASWGINQLILYNVKDEHHFYMHRNIFWNLVENCPN